MDTEFYLNHKEEINAKSNSYKEIQSKINREEVINMYKSGIMQKDIAKYFNASNGTISDILKIFKISSIS